MIKPVRYLLVAVFSIVVAFTPLTSTFSHSQHDAWFPRWDSFNRPHVVLDDRTGFVIATHAVGYAPAQNSRVDRLLVVSWLGGCSEQEIELIFEAIEPGYRITMTRTMNGCGFLVGLARTLVLTVRWPVDASTVQFDVFDGSVT